MKTSQNSDFDKEKEFQDLTHRLAVIDAEIEIGAEAEKGNQVEEHGAEDGVSSNDNSETAFEDEL
ncbi:MAG: hypothetical protein LBV19_10800 [Streptococcaceae bacterium]|nr:hypothetical protein [Streptococcaceae bacterium]